MNMTKLLLKSNHYHIKKNNDFYKFETLNLFK